MDHLHFGPRPNLSVPPPQRSRSPLPAFTRSRDHQPTSVHLHDCHVVTPNKHHGSRFHPVARGRSDEQVTRDSSLLLMLMEKLMRWQTIVMMMRKP